GRGWHGWPLGVAAARRGRVPRPPGLLHAGGALPVAHRGALVPRLPRSHLHAAPVRSLTVAVPNGSPDPVGVVSYRRDESRCRKARPSWLAGYTAQRSPCTNPKGTRPNPVRKGLKRSASWSTPAASHRRTSATGSH